MDLDSLLPFDEGVLEIPPHFQRVISDLMRSSRRKYVVIPLIPIWPFLIRTRCIVYYGFNPYGEFREVLRR